MTNLDLKELAREIHENAKAKGFYDDAGDKEFVNHQYFEIIKEIGEMHEAFKKNRFAAELNEKETIESFEADIKDTFEDEMADVVIRLLDFMYYFKLPISQPSLFPDGIEKLNSKYWLSLECVKMINILTKPEYYIWMDVVNHIYTIADSFDVDLDKHILAKMEYNKQRERLHGKRF